MGIIKSTRINGVVALSIFGLLMTACSSQSLNTDSAPVVKIINPADIKVKDGMSEHRRILSKENDGSINIDIGHNRFKAGIGSDKPYAYTLDEVCYIPSGKIMALSDGEKVIVKPGYFMWRPAGAATQKTKIINDSETICAFAPTREEGKDYAVPQSDIGKWEGKPEDKPKVIFRDYRDIAPVIKPGIKSYVDGKIVQRLVFSKSDDGEKFIDANHSFYTAGLEITGPVVYEADEICWLESGEIEMVNNGVKEILKSGYFLYRPAGAITDRVKVTKNSVSICFFAPMR